MAKAKRVTVRIHRDVHHITADVFAHEVPILEAAHGQGAVQVTKTLPGTVEIENLREEFERLQRKYVRRNADPLRFVYPAGEADLARALSGKPAAAAGDAGES